MAGGTILDFLKVVLIVSLFYSFAITIITYSLPTAVVHHVSGYTDMTDSIDFPSIQSDVQGALSSSTKVPFAEVGALIWYSGNILVDLILNFAFAPAQMLTLLINTISQVIHIEIHMLGMIQLFASVIVMILYMVGTLETLTNIRAGVT